MKVTIKNTGIENKELKREEIDHNLHCAISIDLCNFLMSEHLVSHRDEARILLVEAFKDMFVREAIVKCVENLYDRKLIGFSYEENSRYMSR